MANLQQSDTADSVSSVIEHTSAHYPPCCVLVSRNTRHMRRYCRQARSSGFSPQATGVAVTGSCLLMPHRVVMTAKPRGVRNHCMPTRARTCLLKLQLVPRIRLNPFCHMCIHNLEQLPVAAQPRASHGVSTGRHHSREHHRLALCCSWLRCRLQTKCCNNCTVSAGCHNLQGYKHVLLIPSRCAHSSAGSTRVRCSIKCQPQLCIHHCMAQRGSIVMSRRRKGGECHLLAFKHVRHERFTKRSATHCAVCCTATSISSHLELSRSEPPHSLRSDCCPAGLGTGK
jgi:hypothetical protein